MIGRITLSVVAAGVGLLLAAPVWAHHAFGAEFDVNKPLKLRGSVTKWEMINPHSWIHLDVKSPDGTMTVWSVETIGPNGLRRLGLSDRRLFVIGETYKIDINPDRSGKTLGFVNSFTFPDGKFIKVGFPEEEGGEPPR